MNIIKYPTTDTDSVVIKLRHFFIACLLILSISCGQQSTLEPLQSDATIVAFGNSLTFGTGTNRESSYPSVLQQLTGLTVINEGIPGHTTEDGLKRIDKVLTQYNPELVILCLGGNDFLRKKPINETKTNLLAIIDKIKQGGSQVVLVAVPKFGILIGDAELYAEIAKQTQVPLLEDVLSDYLSDRTLKSDTIHLNKQGYYKLAESIQQFLIARGALPK